MTATLNPLTLFAKFPLVCRIQGFTVFAPATPTLSKPSSARNLSLFPTLVEMTVSTQNLTLG